MVHKHSQSIKRIFILLVLCLTIQQPPSISMVVKGAPVEATDSIYNEVSELNQMHTQDDITNAAKSFWAKTYRSDTGDVVYFNDILYTSDGGFLVIAVTGPYWATWILKLDAHGNVIWQKEYHLLTLHMAISAEETEQGDYVIAGHGFTYFWLLKIDAQGYPIWQKTYQSNEDQSSFVEDMDITHDGGFVIAGRVSYSGLDNLEAFIMKLDQAGQIIWQKRYGARGEQKFTGVIADEDGSVVAVGRNSEMGQGGGDIWVIKLDSEGMIIWQKTYGTSESDGGNSITHGLSSGYIIGGRTGRINYGPIYSLNGTYYDNDGYLLHISDEGAIIWQKRYDVTDYDEINVVQATLDNSYLVAGLRRYPNIHSSFFNFWVMKVSATGDVIWSRTAGSDNDDQSWALAITHDSYVVCGDTVRNLINNGWILKINTDGYIRGGCPAIEYSSGGRSNVLGIAMDTNEPVTGTTTLYTTTIVTPTVSSPSFTEETQCLPGICYIPFMTRTELFVDP